MEVIFDLDSESFFAILRLIAGGASLDKPHLLRLSKSAPTYGELLRQLDGCFGGIGVERLLSDALSCWTYA